MVNSILPVIQKRRNIYRFETTPVENSKIQTILEAGRWAPSWTNSQPWKFILITDDVLKQMISEKVVTVFNLAVKEAPVSIVVCVDSKRDPYHFVEDGAVATQNMALTAYSLGLGSSWIGIFNFKKERGSVEEKIKTILNIPKHYRIVSILSIGIPKYVKEKEREPLNHLVFRNKFGTSD